MQFETHKKTQNTHKHK